MGTSIIPSSKKEFNNPPNDDTVSYQLSNGNTLDFAVIQESCSIFEFTPDSMEHGDGSPLYEISFQSLPEALQMVQAWEKKILHAMEKQINK